MGDYVTLDEAAQRSGLHPNGLKRLLRQGTLHGFKTAVNGRRQWLVYLAVPASVHRPGDGLPARSARPQVILEARER